MGGSTNTILHLLAAAQEAERDFTMARHRPPLAPRAAAVQGRAQHARSTTSRTCTAPAASWPSSASSSARGLLHTDVPTVHASTLGDAIAKLGHHAHRDDDAVHTFFRAGPAGIPTQVAFSQSTRWPTLDADRAKAASATSSTPTRRKAAWPCCTATSRADGCVVKTAGVDEAILRVRRPGARVREPGRRRCDGDPRRRGEGGRRGGDPLRRPARAARACRRCCIRPAT